MPSQAKGLFDRHLIECREAVTLYEYIERTSSFRADFNLRFVWIAAVSAFDQYISQLILERATEAFANSGPLAPKMLSEALPFGSALSLRKANPVEAVVVFREILGACIRHKSFQSPDKVADGLSYIWSEKYKWVVVAKAMGTTQDLIKETLGAIVDRRNLIAHNADYDEALGSKLPVSQTDAIEVIAFLEKLAQAIDNEIGS